MFITFEGGEGSGKSTQILLLKDFLCNKISAKIHLRREPGSKDIESCKEIREILLRPKKENLSSRAELFLYLADRAEHVEKFIKPALAVKDWILCDRFQDSTIVYQGIARGLGIDNIKNMIDYASCGIVPDLTFIFDIDPSVGLNRAVKNNKEFTGGDVFEKETIEFHEKIRQGFLDLAKSDKRYVVVNANSSIDDICKEVRSVVERIINTGGI